MVKQHNPKDDREQSSKQCGACTGWYVQNPRIRDNLPSTVHICDCLVPDVATEESVWSLAEQTTEEQPSDQPLPPLKDDSRYPERDPPHLPDDFELPEPMQGTVTVEVDIEPDIDLTAEIELEDLRLPPPPPAGLISALVTEELPSATVIVEPEDDEDDDDHATCDHLLRTGPTLIPEESSAEPEIALAMFRMDTEDNLDLPPRLVEIETFGEPAGDATEELPDQGDFETVIIGRYGRVIKHYKPLVDEIPPVTKEEFDNPWFSQGEPPKLPPVTPKPSPPRHLRPIMTKTKDELEEENNELRSSLVNASWKNWMQRGIAVLAIVAMAAIVCLGFGINRFYNWFNEPDVVIAKAAPVTPPVPAPVPIIEVKEEPAPRPVLARGRTILDCSDKGREPTADPFTRRFNFIVPWSENKFETYYVHGIDPQPAKDMAGIPDGACITLKTRQPIPVAQIVAIESMDKTGIWLPEGLEGSAKRPYDLYARCDKATAARCVPTQIAKSVATK